MEIKEKYNKINKVLDYIENVLEVPRDEYGGMSACPFAKKERENDNLYIDVIDKDNGFFLLMDHLDGHSQVSQQSLQPDALLASFDCSVELCFSRRQGYRSLRRAPGLE